MGSGVNMTMPLLPQQGSIKGMWKLDEYSAGTGAVTRNDSSSKANHLIDTNTTASGTAKIGAYSASFVAANSEKLSISDATQTGLDITNNLTICYWGKYSASANLSGLYTICKWLGTTRSYLLGVETKVLLMISSDGGWVSDAANKCIGTTTILAATWYHFAGTFASGTGKVYLNGSLETTNSTMPASIYNNAIEFAVGSANAGGNFTDGLVDEVIVWNTILTADEILRVKNITSYCYAGGLGIGNPYIF